jgi:polyisoprenyl-phosphate glycosyltransferase
MTTTTFNSNELISLVVPLYNEEAVIDGLFSQVIPILKDIPQSDYEIVCVNDGSSDRTLDRLLKYSTGDQRIQIVDLSRRFGKEAAITAGIDYARGDVVIPFDADLQDPPQAIRQLVDKWREGFDVVIARRCDRAADTYAKRRTAAMFYKLHNAISDIKIPEDTGDFRLMSRLAVEALKQLPENRRFMKGLFAWIGFNTAQIEYSRQPRSMGQTKFSGWKLWNFALEGITSFGTLPLRVWTYIGGVTALSAICYAAYLTLRTEIRGVDVPGYASVITAVLLLGGVQLIGIGVIGEYVGRVYMESKRRPIYIVRKVYGRVDG